MNFGHTRGTGHLDSSRFRTLVLLGTAALISACGQGSNSLASPANVNVSGFLSYEFPPPGMNCLGLDHANTLTRPIRRATVQLLNAAGDTVLVTTVSGEGGDYSLNVDPGTNYIFRVRAELKSANWDVEVRNNVDTSGSPPPLGQRPLYVLDFPFNSGTASNRNLNLTAETGWGNTSYTGARAAAPFAIMDTIYSGMEFVIAADPNATFTALDVFWSPDNKAANPADIDAGDLSTSYYSVGQNRIYLLGFSGPGGDTDEFDDHVLLHEWGHYFDDNYSRSDSWGGRHGGGQLLDARVAFSEGWPSALAAMALDNPVYCDTFTPTSGGGFSSESSRFGTEGWFNEQTVNRLIYDLWDTNDDGADNSSIGFGPIYDVMTGPQASTSAFTSVFTFATYLKQLGTGQDTFIDALLSDSDITPAGIDIWGSTELNDGPGMNVDVLPIYTPLTLGVTETICINSQFDSGRDGNKLSEHRYFRLNLASDAQVTFTMNTLNPPSVPADPNFDCVAAIGDNDSEASMHSDPDFLVSREGQYYAIGWSCEPNSESTATQGLLLAGDYVIDIEEGRFGDENSPAGFPEQVCYDFTAN